MLNMIRKFLQSDKKVIVDCSHLRTTPERNFFHPVFVLLFTLAVIASMWQYSHAGMTLLILSLILPVAVLCYVPYKYIGLTFRFALQVLIFAAITAWGFYAVKKGLISDKITLVILGYAGISFLMGRRKRDYGYLFVISTVLMIYGALLARLLYLYLFAGYFLGCIIIFYGNRLINISGDFELPGPVSKKRPKVVFPYMGHLFFTLLFALVVFFLLPKLPTETKGLIEVSFHTEKESFAPEDLQKWLSRKDTKKIHDPKGQFVADGVFVDALSANAAKEANIRGVTSKKEGAGAGDPAGGQPGNALLFSVSSPLKLYHIGRVYNRYDGRNWRLDRALSNRKLRTAGKNEVMPLHTDIEVRYYVEKFISPTLFAPYLPIEYDMSHWQNVSISQDIFGARLAPRQSINMPFRYKVSVRQFLFSKKNPAAGEKGKKGKKTLLWVEPGRPEHYLSLPSKKISKRLRKFTMDLVKDHKGNYAKAIAIRDHLRKNYPYKQNAGKVPPKKESVDHFIFELKEGHCEYFASAMAVMARIAKIPSRLVTGYSPGNYNTLVNRFEVYEYHAHAWTQLYFPEHGWLTFDATPPGQVVSRTTPAGIGSLRDPFGDEWRITPPELASSNRSYVEKKIEEALMEEEKKKDEYKNALARIVERGELQEQKTGKKAVVKKKLKKAPPTLKAKIRSFFRNWTQRSLCRISYLWGRPAPERAFDDQQDEALLCQGGK